MTDKDKGTFNFGNITQEGTGHAVVDQSEGKTITVNNNGDADPWAEVAATVDSEIPEGEREEVTQKVEALKEAAQNPNTDPTVFEAMVSKLKPYQPLGRVLLAAAKATPAGAVLGPLIAGAYEASKI